ncbi:cytochrome c oxidase cbb3-type subunit 3 [Sediminitomix flava]|uniref:Cytochrome c oxidase cbb3-type subunit 3 n=2 Tax=Sediminitomix flava TaxID=379075 RepID=A0A315Z821_SEDFL|nr:cytochrome c oxidase cbb3-type subunit 3 [Sediminitomix flava]
MLSLLVTGHSAMAASTESLFDGIGNLEVLIGAMLGVIVILFIAVLLVSLTLYKIVSKELKANLSEEELAYEEEGGYQWFWQRFNAAKPIALEKEILLAHEYDGIRELDNDLPPWWKYLFYVSIVFAGVYIYIYHTGVDTPVSVSEYQTEVAEAEAEIDAYLAALGAAIDESNVERSLEEKDLANGKAIFTKRCVACHAADGGGGIGPNLTDEYWLYGNDVKNIFKTIKYGTSKGMTAWDKKISPPDMKDVASYVMSLQGTTPEAGKAPQGEHMPM